MDKKEALKVLEISDNLSGPDIVCQVKQRLKKLHKDNPEELSKTIEACKFLTDGQEDQAEVFSDLVISAINDDKLDFLELLLKTVKNGDKFNYLNTEGTGGNIPLNFALGHTSYKHESRIKAISLLLKYGANPNTKDREGKSSLHCVINNSDGVFCHKVTELLLEYKVDPNAKDSQGKTLLHYLCENNGYLNDCARGRVEIAKLLLRKGANPDLKDNYNKKPIDYAKHDSKVGQLFGAIDYNMALIHSGSAATLSFLSIGCAVEAAVGNWRKSR
ncbi:MAG: ankyrin repeat domain-containing protein [Rickettsiales bacterium]|jgi:ankyrin repeat protein|nr:ankyrin repeat domain-containing protein [Rickettsiales bacterium]MDR1261116.1 ankyrin repeat domain-containing protein [Rickettsiales bacterium]